MVNIIVALPAYNEEAGLPPLLDSMEEVFASLVSEGFSHSYLIVNDGSSDGTQLVLDRNASRLPLEIVRHEINLGLGPTMQDALRGATERAADQDLIITMDADNTHPPQLMIPMIHEIQAGNDIVIASRYRRGAEVVGLSGFRTFMSYGALAVMKLIFPIPGVRDYTSGFRAYRASLLRRAFEVYGDSFIDQVGFQCMADILFKLSYFKPVITEVPLVLRYDRKGGASSMNVGKTVKDSLLLVIKRRFSRSPL